MKRQPSMSVQSRRDFLRATAVAAATAGIVATGCDEQPGQMEEAAVVSRTLPVGLQLYSVRAECAKDLPGTIAKVAAMGYEGVEFAGYYDCKAEDIRKMLDDNGLACCGTHTAMDTLSDANLTATIEFNKTLGNKYLIVPWLQPDESNPKQTWLKYAERFNELAEKVKAHDMLVGYHNHAHDFAAVDDTTGWDLLAGNTDPDVVMQIDTGNALSGGADPIVYLKRYPGRSVTVHIKEYSETNKNALIGEGDIPWDQVFMLCETIGGTEWYIIEEEKDVYPPLEGVELSLKNLKKLRGVEA